MGSRVRKAIITAAGRGSRMKYVSSYMPKALLPLFYKENGEKVMVPIIDLIVSSLSRAGVEKFCVVVGRQGKMLVDYLGERMDLTFVTQDQPRGFGDAVLRGEDFTGGEPFFVHADDGVLTGGYEESASLYEQNAIDGVLLLRKVENPRRYGVVTAKEIGQFMGHKLYKVLDAEEKPHEPKSDLAISAVYVLNTRIFQSLRSVRYERELELTYGIADVIKLGGEVYGLLLENEKWLNVGDPDSYFKALEFSYTNFLHYLD
jgi:dTDP-glucose pyrophosphorylase